MGSFSMKQRRKASGADNKIWTAGFSVFYDILRLTAGNVLRCFHRLVIGTYICKYSCSGCKGGQGFFIAPWEQPQQSLVCRAGPVVFVLKNTVICRYIESPADMVKTFNACRAAAALQILLEPGFSKTWRWIFATLSRTPWILLTKPPFCTWLTHRHVLW